MSEMDGLLHGIVADPHDVVRWLVLADWLDDHDQPERAELVRVHRELLRTCTRPNRVSARPQLHARMMELMRSGVKPCLPERTLTLPGEVELKLSFIPPGSFLMGSPSGEQVNFERDGEPLHRVTLTRAFWMGVTPVLRSQWRAVMGRMPAAAGASKNDRLPVNRLTQEEADAFCARLSEMTGEAVRLPTEAEWEYACRAGTTTRYYWGDSLNGTEANVDGNYPHGTEEKGPNLNRLTEPGRYAAISPHPWGLLDMIGNVMEFCSDYRGSHSSRPQTNPAGPPGDPRTDWRMMRGGAFDSLASYCRSASRDCHCNLWPLAKHGFRIVIGMPGDPAPKPRAERKRKRKKRKK